MTNATPPDVRYEPPTDPMSVVKLALAWLFVGIPLVWAVWEVFVRALVLFHEGT